MLKCPPLSVSKSLPRSCCVKMVGGLVVVKRCGEERSCKRVGLTVHEKRSFKGSVELKFGSCVENAQPSSPTSFETNTARSPHGG